jgi:hypothetical protein
LTLKRMRTRKMSTNAMNVSADTGKMAPTARVTNASSEGIETRRATPTLDAIHSAA